MKKIKKLSIWSWIHSFAQLL